MNTQILNTPESTPSKAFHGMPLRTLLTDEGLNKLAIIIDQAVQMMKTCSNYYEFRQKWFEEYGVPYQLNFFGENNK